MKEQPKVGAGQLFLLLFLSRVVLTLTYSIGSGGHSVNNADWLAALFLPAFLILLAIPVFVFLRYSANQDVCHYAYQLGRGWGHTVSVLYAIFFFLLTYSPVARFSFFVTSVMQPEKGEWFFPILILIPVCFAAIKGIQAILRTGAILAVVSILSIFVIVVALLTRFDMLNIYTPLYYGWKEVGRSTVLMISNSLELGMILMLAPLVRGNIKKAYLGYALGAPACLFVVLFTVVAVLGPYANLQLFPFYAVAGIAKIGELTNLSAAEASVWIMGVFIKSSTYLYLCHTCLARIIPSKYRSLSLLLLSIAAIAAAASSSGNVKNAWLNFSVEGTLIIGGLFLMVIPLTLVVAGKMKRRKQNEKSRLPVA